MTSGNHSIDVESTLRLMDVADEIRRQRADREQVLEELEANARERVRAHVLRIYEGLGESIEPNDVDEAIDRFLAEQHRFRPPFPGVETTLARWYVRRKELFRRYGPPIVGAALLGATILGGALTWKGVSLRRQERAVERGLAALAETHQALNSRVQTAFDNPESEPDRERLDKVRQVLEGVSGFFDTHMKEGDPESAVTAENFADIESLSRSVRVRLDEAESSLSDVESRLSTLAALAEAGASAERALEAIRAVSREPSALTEAESLRDEAERYRAAGDLEGLEEALSRLEEIELALESEFRVVILGGVWRYKNDEPNLRNYYLRVHAVDEEGRAQKLRVTNEETGSVEVVTEWGERVPKEIYDRVAADKSDNGLIDEDTFAVKRRGFLQAEREYENLGQITRW